MVENLLIQKDLPIMILSTLACMPIFWTNGRISRKEGGLLLTLYFFYLIDQVLPQTLPGWHAQFRLIILCIFLPMVMVIITYQTVHYWNKVKRVEI